MRRSLALFVFAFVVATAPAFAQVNFDAGAPCVAFPSPIGAGGDPEGVSWNGAGAGNGRIACKSGPGGGGFPVFGAQFAEMLANGPGGGFSPPAGGPVARPLAGGVNETGHPDSLQHDVHHVQLGLAQQRSRVQRRDEHRHRDGGRRPAHAPRVRREFDAPRGRVRCIVRRLRRSSDRAGRPELHGQARPRTTPAGAYLSVACWNGTDNVAPGHVRIDNIRFGSDRSAVTFDRPGADCGYTFPLCGVGGDPEGVGWNGAGGANVSGVAGCGFPIGGCGKSLRVQANGPPTVTPASGGPLARPLAGPVTEVCVPLPAFTTDISFCWDFYTNKASSSFNDGLSIDIVAPGGALVQSLVYADTFTPSGPCSWGGSCGAGGAERAPAGPNYFKGNFPQIPAGAYLSIACWNGGDNVAPSSAAVDNIITGGPQLDYHSPGGAGSGTLSLQNIGFTAGDSYYMTATVNGAGFPNGWFYGINISIGELVQQVTGGLPFSGTLNACGHSCFTSGECPGRHRRLPRDGDVRSSGPVPRGVGASRDRDSLIAA